MTKQFDLSEKIVFTDYYSNFEEDNPLKAIPLEDVAEFIKRLMFLQMKYFQSTHDDKVIFLGEKYSDYIKEFKELAGKRLSGKKIK